MNKFVHIIPTSLLVLLFSVAPVSLINSTQNINTQLTAATQEETAYFPGKVVKFSDKSIDVKNEDMTRTFTVTNDTRILTKSKGAYSKSSISDLKQGDNVGITISPNSDEAKLIVIKK